MRAKKEMGQHFLIQESIAERLANALPSEGYETIVEVGPGKGILTQYLLKLSRPVLAIELDRDLIPFLQKEFAATSLRLVQGDVLRSRFDELLTPSGEFVLVGNFPYNISSQIIFLGIHWRHRIPVIAGMFQREMAERICSGPGSKVYGIISVLAQAYYHPTLLFHVKPGSFSPPPKVNSSVIALTRYRTEIEGVSFSKLRQVVKMAFAQRRKKVRNTLKSLIPEEVLTELGVTDLRPEQLSLDQFIELAKRAIDFPPV